RLIYLIGRNMMVPIITVSLIVAFVLLISSAIYLAFHKPKTVGTSQPPVWMVNLPEPARNVRLKEFNKEISSVFTREWFFEYWRGERSPFNAWFTWFFMGGLGVSIGVFVSFFCNLNIAIEKFIPVVLVLYVLMSGVILWRCAINSTTFYKYFARIFVLFVVFKALY
ncbi:MAG: hypothetical protein K2X39_07315, partial [Silvanigrellaceae bacterium]|nr:hypothetical protein [Silvanigrellaceae bacterium]